MTHSDQKAEKDEEHRQNMKYDSSTGKLYEELGCSNNNTTGSAPMDTLTSSQPSTSSTTSSSTGMAQTQQVVEIFNS